MAHRTVDVEHNTGSLFEVASFIMWIAVSGGGRRLKVLRQSGKQLSIDEVENLVLLAINIVQLRRVETQNVARRINVTSRTLRRRWPVPCRWLPLPGPFDGLPSFELQSFGTQRRIATFLVPNISGRFPSGLNSFDNPRLKHPFIFGSFKVLDDFGANGNFP